MCVNCCLLQILGLLSFSLELEEADLCRSEVVVEVTPSSVILTKLSSASEENSLSSLIVIAPLP